MHVPTDLLLAIDRQRYAALEEIFRFHGVYSAEKLRRDVPEFGPATAYEDGVRQTVAWMDAHKKIEPAGSDPFEDELVAAWDSFTRDAVQRFSPKT